MKAETSSEHSSLLAAEGDTLEFRDRQTFQPRPQGQARLVRLSGLQATLDHVPLAAMPGDLVVSLSWLPSVVVRACQTPDTHPAQATNNTYRNNRARGMLVKTHNVLITNNTFDGCTGPAVQVFTDGCFWFLVACGRT